MRGWKTRSVMAGTKARLATGLIVNLGFVVCFILSMSTGWFRHVRSIPDPFAWELKKSIGVAFMILIPSATVLFLVPVIVRGSVKERLIAIVLCLLPAYIAYLAWGGLIAEHFIYNTG